MKCCYKNTLILGNFNKFLGIFCRDNHVICEQKESLMPPYPISQFLSFSPSLTPRFPIWCWIGTVWDNIYALFFGSINYWNWGVAVSSHNTVLSFSPWSFIRSCLRCFDSLILADYILWIFLFLEIWPLYHHVIVLLIPDNIPCSEMTCSEINIAIPTYFIGINMAYVSPFLQCSPQNSPSQFIH